MHYDCIFTKSFPPENGYVIVDSAYGFSGVGMTQQQANELRMNGDKYRIKITLKEQTNA